MKTPEHVLKNRHNKLARGMTRTIYESNQRDRLSDDAATLSVKGTLDKLHGLLWYTRHISCSTCGCKCRGKLELNDHGKRLLAYLRRKQQERLRDKYSALDFWRIRDF